MGKYVFGARPKHPFKEKVLVSGIAYTLVDPETGKGIGKLVWKEKHRHYLVLCYSERCDRYFGGGKK